MKEKLFEKSAMAVVIYENKILSTSELIYGKECLSLPKGHVEKNETLVDTAIRECFEETNIKLKRSDFVKSLTPFTIDFLNHHKERVNKTIYPNLFIINDIGNPKSKEKRIKTVKWMEIDKFIENCTYQNVKDVVSEVINKKN